MTWRVAVVEGDDAAPEVVRPAVEVISATGAPIEWLPIPSGDLEAERPTIDRAAATFFGATSGRSTALLIYLRWGRETYANVRPVRYLPGARSPLAAPDGVDFVIVRENLEDLYVGLEGDVAELAPLGFRDRRGRPVAESGPGAYAVRVITEARTAAVARAACRLARDRARRRGRPAKLTIGTKHNLLRRSDGLFLDTARAVAADFAGLAVESAIVDDLAHRLVSAPRELDVVLLPNFTGDILSDAAAGLVGGLGVAPSGCYGDDYAYFEPVHGTAPDLAGRGVINPTAQLLSGAMMLDYLGAVDEAARLTAAIEAVYAAGTALTPDQGGTASTREFTDAVLAELDRAPRGRGSLPSGSPAQRHAVEAPEGPDGP